MLRLSDAIGEIAGSRRTSAGYLVVPGCVARANNVQVYAAHELGRPGHAAVRIWRPEGEVMSAKSLSTLGYAPITIDHPDGTGAVDATSWRAKAVGFVGADVLRSGDTIRCDLMIADAIAQAAILAGRRQLSAGYTLELDDTPGTSPRGEAYDAVARNIRYNHVSCVIAGRAGSECRLGDTEPPHPSAGGQPIMSDQFLNDQALIQDAAGRLADTVRGLSPAEQQQVLQRALVAAGGLAQELRGRSPDSARGRHLAHLQNAWRGG